MTPTYSDGDYILAAKWPKMSTAKGDIVVVKHPNLGVIVKRVSNIVESHYMLLQGDNPKSTSSETMGLVNKGALIGKVVSSFKQK